MLKKLKWVAIVLLFLVFLIAVGLFWYRSASQPQVSGAISLRGIAANVDILRDAEGIPHIYAQSQADAVFALGFAHAQDRLWQMEMNRRIAAGRVAEILGPSALDTDRFLRTLGVRRNAEAIVGNLPPQTRAILDAYAAGVNAYLEQRTGPLPPEFLLTGAPAPAPWSAADSVSWQTMMAWDLSGNWGQELLRLRLAQRLPIHLIREVLAPYPGDAPLPTMDYTSLYRQLIGTTAQLAAVMAVAPAGMIESKGSNNWVVDGALTQSGKPLLANDPHLSLSAPALWYFAHLSAPEGNVIGATLPGVPGVVLGRNDRIAWGFTNTGPDTQDLYVERINPDAPQQYQTPSGWVDFKQRTETIKVKGQPDVTLTVRETRHGPVITGVLPIVGRAGLDANKYAIAFSWTALRSDDLTAHATFALQQAKNWPEFVTAVKDFSAPQQNMVYADVDGNIGYIAPGRVPMRKADNDLKGLAPAPGWDARYDWDGFIPFDQLPRSFNPSTHRVITANQKIIADDYPYFITSEWSLPFRANRIAELLDEKIKVDDAKGSAGKLDIDAMQALQKDVKSLAARNLLPILTQAKARSARAKEAVELLAKWDGTMDAERREPLIYSAWVRQASKAIFSDELGEDLMKDYWDLRNLQQSMINVLGDVNGQSRWCGNALQPNPAANGKEICAEVLAGALDAALADLDRRFGSDMNTWQWGVAHQARSEHRPFGKVDALAPWFDIRIPTSGDGDTVNVGRATIRDEKEAFTSRHAASLRAVYDLADLENSRFIHSTGQSGNVFSPLYRNFNQRWAAAQTLPMRTNRARLESDKLGTLTLMPAR